MMAQASYNLIDRIFVGHALGSEGIAGTTVAFPFMLVVLAFGMMIGIGGTALISIRLGEGKKTEAEHVLGNARALWVQATAEQRVRLQAVLFPEGVPFDGSRFGTAVTCLAFAQLPEPGGQKDGVASPTGFELCYWG